MPGEIRTVGGVTAQWDGQGWKPIQPTQGAEPSISPEHGILPSGLSTAGSMLGSFLGLPGKIAGSVLGTSANELATSIPKLVEMARHGGGLIGPVSSEGVGEAMAAPLAHTAEDLAGNAALEYAVPNGIKWGLGKAAQAAKAIGENTPGISTLPGMVGRSALGGLAHMLGIPTPVTAAGEIASVVAPPLARAAAPALQAASDVMPTTTSSVVRGTLRALKPGIRAAEEAAPKTPYIPRSVEVPGFSYRDFDPFEAVGTPEPTAAPSIRGLQAGQYEGPSTLVEPSQLPPSATRGSLGPATTIQRPGTLPEPSVLPEAPTYPQLGPAQSIQLPAGEMGATPEAQAMAERTIQARVDAMSREGLRRALANPERYRPTADELIPNYDWAAALKARTGVQP